MIKAVYKANVQNSSTFWNFLRLQNYSREGLPLGWQWQLQQLQQLAQLWELLSLWFFQTRRNLRWEVLGQELTRTFSGKNVVNLRSPYMWPSLKYCDLKYCRVRYRTQSIRCFIRLVARAEQMSLVKALDRDIAWWRNSAICIATTLDAHADTLFS